MRQLRPGQTVKLAEKGLVGHTFPSPQASALGLEPENKVKDTENPFFSSHLSAPLFPSRVERPV